ncbi:MAG TPA: hypothetical protein VF875_17585 [Anaeromyxobacter sp.]
MASGRPVFEIAYLPTTFVVGTHAIVLAKAPGSERWTLTLDGTLSSVTFQTEVEAWEAGVRGADQLDRPAPPR